MLWKCRDLFVAGFLNVIPRRIEVIRSLLRKTQILTHASVCIVITLTGVQSKEGAAIVVIDDIFEFHAERPPELKSKKENDVCNTS